MTNLSTQESTATILVIEDHKETRIFLELALSDDYLVDCATDATEALQMAKKRTYDLFLIDIALQDSIDGVEVARQLRQLPRYGDTPMIAMTAHRKGRYRESFLEQGFDEFLAKPFFPEDLLEAIERLVSSSSGSGEESQLRR